MQAGTEWRGEWQKGWASGKHDGEEQSRADALAGLRLKDEVELAGAGTADVREDGMEILY